MSCSREKPTITNNKEEAPLQYYLRKFAALDPGARAATLGIRYETGTFYLEFYGMPQEVRWPDGRILSPREDALTNRYASARILLLRYLVEGMAIPGTGKSLPFLQLPWGAVYLKTFDGRCIKRSAFKFGTNIEEFRQAAAALGGTPSDHGDAAFIFPVVPGYTLEMIVWEGDDEFPPSAQILFSDNFAVGFTAEDSVVAAELLINMLGGAMRRPSA